MLGLTNVFYMWAMIDSLMFIDPLTLVFIGIIGYAIYSCIQDQHQHYDIHHDQTADNVNKDDEKQVHLFEKKPVDANDKVELKVSPHANVLYADLDDVRDQRTNLLMHVYDKHTNAGVVRADEHGIVVLELRKAYNIMYVEIDQYGNFINADKAVIAREKDSKA